MNSSLVPLGEVVTFKGGGTPSRDNPKFWGGPIPWATVKDFCSGNSIHTTQESITELGLEESASHLIPAGTVVIPTRMALGKAAIVERPIAINQDLRAVFPHERIEPKYLLWFFLSSAKKIEAMGKGATVKGVTHDQLRRLEIPVPSLPEQRRIAAILDKADALRAKRREAIAKLDQLLQSVFLDMFGDPVTNPRCWPIVNLGDLIAEGPQNGIYKPASDYGSGVPILRIDGFKAGDVILAPPAKRVRLSSADQMKYQLREADLVINRVNSPEHLGKPVLIGSLSEPVVFESNMMRLTLNQARISPHYLLKCMLQQHVRDQISRCRKDAVNQSSINQDDVRALMINLPPMAMQNKYASAMAASTAQQRLIAASVSKLDALLATLTSRAFSGAW